MIVSIQTSQGLLWNVDVFLCWFDGICLSLHLFRYIFYKKKYDHVRYKNNEIKKWLLSPNPLDCEMKLFGLKTLLLCLRVKSFFHEIDSFVSCRIRKLGLYLSRCVLRICLVSQMRCSTEYHVFDDVGHFLGCLAVLSDSAVHFFQSLL